MGDPPGDDSIEDRVESIETEMNDIAFEKIEARIDVIETEQEQLRADLDTAFESIRAQGDEIPHADSIQELHTRLAGLEENVSALRRSLEEIVDQRE